MSEESFTYIRNLLLDEINYLDTYATNAEAVKRAARQALEELHQFSPRVAALFKEKCQDTGS